MEANIAALDARSRTQIVSNNDGNPQKRSRDVSVLACVTNEKTTAKRGKI